MILIEDPITRWFEAVLQESRSITLHHPLTHTTGFPGAIGDDFDVEATRDAFLAQAMACELIDPPGARYEYSNVGYSLLGIVIEIASGQGYEEFLRERLFLPAGMTRTGYLLPGFTEDDLAVGYRDGERWGAVLDHPMLPDGPSWHLRANGGIHSTPRDMFRWHLALEGEEILSAAAKEKLFRPHVDEGGGDSFYAYGWAVFTTPRGTTLLAHNGGNGIFAADCRRYVDEGVFLFVASSAEISAIGVSERIASILFGAEVPLPPVAVEIAPDRLAAYAGTYRLPSGASIEVRTAPGRLLLHGTDEDAIAALTGGGLPEDVDRDLRERAVSITRAWIDGDLRPTHEALGGRLTLAEVEEVSGSILARWTEELGPVEAVASLPSTAGPAVRRSYAEVRMERGGRYVVYEWAGERLAGIGIERSRPPETEGRREVFPTAPDRFESFRIDAPAALRVRFEPGILILEDGRDEIRAARRS